MAIKSNVSPAYPLTGNKNLPGDGKAELFGYTGFITAYKGPGAALARAHGEFR